MKKTLILIPLLFFSKFFSQFNTVSYSGRHNSIAIAPISENHFSGNFLSYHLEGKMKEKIGTKAKDTSAELQTDAAKRNATAESPALELSLENNENSDSAYDMEEDLPSETDHEQTAKRIRYKKLNLITQQNYDFAEKQIVFMPLKRMTITSNYGNRFHPVDKVEKFHAGVDLRANNDYVFSVLDGIVSELGYTSGAGNYIKIRHGDFETIYMHLSHTFFSEGDIIYAGDIIALSGNTGKSTAPHLHFAVRENGRYINPVQFLNDLIQTNNALADYNNGK